MSIWLFFLATATAQVDPNSRSETEYLISQYCEPLLAGGDAEAVKAAARADGFKNTTVFGKPMLIKKETFLGLSENPRVCMVQASRKMMFDEGVSLVDAWGSRTAGAFQSPNTTGPDGARVRAWVSPTTSRVLIVSEQINAYKQPVLNFILMPVQSR